MDLQKMEQLLTAYFEGNTTLEEEQLLKQYFTGEEVAPHLKPYQELFGYFVSSREETTTVATNIPKKEITLKGVFKKWYAVAALFVLALGTVYFLEEHSSSSKQQEAQMAFEQTKEALDFFSVHFNESAEKLSYVGEFNNTTNKIFK